MLTSRRNDLSLAELLELTCMCPHEINAFEIELRIRETITDSLKSA